MRITSLLYRTIVTTTLLAAASTAAGATLLSAAKIKCDQYNNTRGFVCPANFILMKKSPLGMKGATVGTASKAYRTVCKGTKDCVTLGCRGQWELPPKNLAATIAVICSASIKVYNNSNTYNPGKGYTSPGKY